MNKNEQNSNNNQRKKNNILAIIVAVIVIAFATFFIVNSLKPKQKDITLWQLFSVMGVQDPALVTNQNITSTTFKSPNQVLEINITANNISLNGYTVTGSYLADKTNPDGPITNPANTYELKYIIKQITPQEKELLTRVVKLAKSDSINNGSLIKLKLNTYNASTYSFWSVLLNLLPFIIGIIFIILIFRQFSNPDGKAMQFAKSNAKLSQGKTVTFKDVAGCDEEKQELEEIIDFLKNPKKYEQMGARIPKGMLLFGSPGTGKTLLAKAVAGEAKVPFFSISGSDFVEMFVGIGASRVRDLFKTAKTHAPCIIFIDEIDAVGRQRGAGLGGGHDEREQTLNQLLVEMDGFNPHSGIIIMAATNRPDVLDPALLRPGRFDRQITIDLPDINARTAILKVHARNKKLEQSVNLEDIARRTPGFSGAQLENLLNEAALLAARRNSTTINTQDIDEGVDRVMMGPAKVSRKYNLREKFVVSYHEAGHAVIGLKLQDANEVQKVTIIPRGNAGGYNLMLPKEETFFRTEKQLLEQITGFLGGRVAEELVFKTVTNGAHNDFEKATQIARAMVTEYGMSNLGTIQYESSTGNVFLGRDYMKEKNFSDQVALEIDNEIRRINNECYEKAVNIIKENRTLLDCIAYYLREVETLTREDILEISQTYGLKRWDETHPRPENDEIVIPD